MIESFRHKGLRRLFEDDDAKGVSAEHVRKLKQILALLEAAQDVADLDVATFRLHASKGELLFVRRIFLSENRAHFSGICA
ncbi:type II toxin-antitoxin system RelE/ParE family toxin [Rhodoblastus sp.]|uniref:type II toxin-antitoxin system RelE/ParE family toxin n=1 Tax=Rhodoblastus sp. TaxID=1962975 RepID=UPI003F963167